MEQVSDALLAIRQTMKLYDQCLDQVRNRYSLSKLEIVIISFLHNNPGHDTAGAVAEMRMLSKGNVSRGVDSLTARGLLERLPDKTDRRWVHLRLKPEADPIVQDIELAAQHFIALTFSGFTEDDLSRFHDLNRKLANNVRMNLERSTLSHGE